MIECRPEAFVVNFSGDFIFPKVSGAAGGLYVPLLAMLSMVGYSDHPYN